MSNNQSLQLQLSLNCTRVERTPCAAARFTYHTKNNGMQIGRIKSQSASVFVGQRFVLGGQERWGLVVIPQAGRRRIPGRTVDGHRRDVGA